MDFEDVDVGMLVRFSPYMGLHSNSGIFRVEDKRDRGGRPPLVVLETVGKVDARAIEPVKGGE